MTAYTAVILIYVICALLGYRYFENARNDVYKKSEKSILFLILFTGFAVRCALAARDYSFSFDTGCFTAWAAKTVEVGFGNMYGGDFFLDYPPFYMYVLFVTQVIKNLLGISGGVADIFAVKLAPMIADIVSGYVIYRFSKRLTDGKLSLYLAALYVFCPMVVYNSAVWGQIDSFLSLFLVLSFCFLVEDRTIVASVCYAVALLTKPQALLFGPVLLFLMIRKADVKETAKALSVGFLCLWGFSLPFSDGLSPLWLINLYRSTMNGYRYFTVNAYNFWRLMNKNWVALDGVAGAEYINTVVITLLLCGTAYLFFRCEKRTAVFNTAFCLISVIFTFGTMMHERYIFPSVIIALFGFIYSGKKYFLALGVASSANGYLNIAMSMSSQYGPYYISPSRQRAVGALCVAVCVAGLVLFAREALKEPKIIFLTEHIAEFALAGIVIVYSLFAFYRLGRTKSPETFWQSGEAGEYFVYTFDSPVQIKEIWTFSGLGDENYPEKCRKVGADISISVPGDGNSRQEIAEITHDRVFKWKKTRVNLYTDSLLIKANKEYSVISEIIVIDANGEIIRGSITDSSCHGAYSPYLALDESETVPTAADDFYYSTYFDEIYFARTAYEMTKGYSLYETTHPPLGKMIIAAGIMLFGMNPFGARVFGVIAGIIMIPVIYLLAWRLFDSKKCGLICAALLSLEFMHYTQSRIATVDTFLVLFCLLSFLFMAYYRKYADETRGIFCLLFGGLSMGCALSVKWNAAFACVGLALFFFMICAERYKNADDKIIMAKNIGLTCVFCLFAFVILPLWVCFAVNVPFLSGGNLARKLRSYLEIQHNIFAYHSGVTATHPYRSPWHCWRFDSKPIWFAVSYIGDKISTISSFGNPIIWIFGFFCVIFCAYYGIKKKSVSFAAVAASWLCALLPWAFIHRPLFIYHYYTCAVFVILAIGGFAKVCTADFQNKKRKRLILRFIVLSAGAFAVFYPVISGAVVPREYTDFLGSPAFWG
ncbi:MAG: phospholipid carrier-dependent glycosyltransferase [Oscillospiraceae bacterium]|nr:phospholipid carrier-dependent glycosyltransferase [Oscillospiraceae bacterium]